MSDSIESQYIDDVRDRAMMAGAIMAIRICERLSNNWEGNFMKDGFGDGANFGAAECAREVTAALNAALSATPMKEDDRG